MARISSTCGTMAFFFIWIRLGVCKLLPTSGCCPPCHCPWNRMAFTFLNGWGKNQENERTFKFLCPYIKFYWNTAMSNHLYIISGCFRTARTKLSSCNRNCLACKTTCLPLPAPGLDNFKKTWVGPVHLCLVNIIVMAISGKCGPPEYWQCWGSWKSYFRGNKLQCIQLEFIMWIGEKWKRGL